MNMLIVVIMISAAYVYGCINTTSFSYTNRRFVYRLPYDTYEPVVFSFCELGCTNDDRCSYFTYINLTHQCQLYDRDGLFYNWNISCSGCFTGTKIETCETQTEEAVVPSTTSELPESTTEIETMCSCVCKETNDSVDDILKERLKALSVNVSNLSASKRKLACAEDSRPSANNIGYFGIILLGLAGGFFIMFDSVSVFRLFIEK